MNKSNHQKELLLMVNATLFSNLCEKIKATEVEWFSQKELLKDACWNGLAPEILPECFDKPDDQAIALMEINDANLFINLQFCTTIFQNENKYSLNPYIFMQEQELN